MNFLVPFIVITNMTAPVAQPLHPDHRHVDIRPQRMLIVDEIYIEQEKGRISATAKSAEPAGNIVKAVPEGPAAVAPPGPTNPTTCDPKNASSPACYTATQQGRAK
jgi:hypothetical protein